MRSLTAPGGGDKDAGGDGKCAGGLRLTRAQARRDSREREATLLKKRHGRVLSDWINSTEHGAGMGDTATTNAASPLRSYDAAIAIGLASLALLTGSLRMAPGVCGGYHDDAIYASTAEALATGQGYRLIDVPGSPRQTKYPWIYPGILSVVWYCYPTFPANLVVMQWVTLGFGAAAVGLGYLYLVRFGYFQRGIAAGAASICATTPYFLYFAVQTMAEMPFALLMVAALWGVESFLLRPEMARRAQFGWGIVLALPFLCRTIGATLIVAGLWVLMRHRRPLRYCVSGIACAVIPWIAWSAAGRGIWDENPVDGYYTDYLGCWSSTGPSMVRQVVSQNALTIVQGSAEMPLEGVSAFVQSWLGPAVSVSLLLFVGLATWLTMISDLNKRRAAGWMLTVYLAAMLVWSWPPYRFLAPILLFLAAYMLSGLAVLLTGRSLTVPRQWMRAIGLGAVLAANGALLVRHVEQTRQTGYPLPKINMTPVEWPSYERTFTWLRENSEPDDVIASGIDSMMALYTDRRAIRPFVYDPGRLFYSGKKTVRFPTAETAGILDHYRPRYFVVSPMPGFAEELPLADVIQRLRQRHPTWFVLRYQDADRRFMVFELDWSHGPAEAKEG